MRRSTRRSGGGGNGTRFAGDQNIHKRTTIWDILRQHISYPDPEITHVKGDQITLMCLREESVLPFTIEVKVTKHSSQLGTDKIQAGQYPPSEALTVRRLPSHIHPSSNMLAGGLLSTAQKAGSDALWNNIFSPLTHRNDCLFPTISC